MSEWESLAFCSPAAPALQDMSKRRRAAAVRDMSGNCAAGEALPQ